MSVHAYFAEKETLLDLFQDWPDHMGVVALLEETEGHHISLYHAEETDRVLGRLCRRLVLPPEELILVSPEGVGPSAPGHPRVRIRFSEDREILELIRRQRDLPERARDYRINFEYVREQGLGTGLDADLNPITPDGEEPLVFSPIPRPEKTGSAWGRWFGEEKEEDPPGVGAPAERAEPEPRFDPDDMVGEDLACHDVPCDPEQAQGYRIIHGQMRVRGPVVELSLDGRGRPRGQARSLQPIGFRDDLSDFLLPPEAFEPDGNGTGVLMEMPRDLFPAGLIGRGGPAPRHVRVAITPWGVRVRPSPGLAGLVRPWRTLLLTLLAALLAAAALPPLWS